MGQLSAEDRLAIADVLAHYCHTLDFGRWDDFVALFAEGCTLDFGETIGSFEGRDGVRRFTEVMKAAGLFMRHFTTNTVVTGDGERAHAETYVLAIAGPAGGQAQTTGVYLDDLVKVDGRWLIRSRRAVLDMP